MHEKQPFQKKTLSIDEQIQLLEARGLHVPDKEYARHYLQYISYYRLSIYARSLQQDTVNHQFYPNTNFNDVIYRYTFDRELRLLLLDAIERIEVAIRSRIVYVFSTSFDAHWYTNNDLFRTTKYFQHAQEMQRIENLCKFSKEIFIRHHGDTYHGLPPSWKLLEAMSMGEIEKLYANLNPKKAKVRDARYQVAQSFGIAPRLMLSWFKPLCLLRNICAHHGRLWNRKLIYHPDVPRHPDIPWVQHEIVDKQKLYIYLCLVQCLMCTVSPQSDWRQRLLQLCTKYQDIPQTDMGFPAEWQHDAFWGEGVKDAQ